MSERPSPEPTFPLDGELTRAAERAIDRGYCAECFGRLFGRWGHGLTNPERAQRLADALGRPPPGATADCQLCEGAFHRWDVWLGRGQRAVEGLEWHSFTCGSRWDPELLAREETIWVDIGTTWAESARGAFNREWGKRMEHATGASGSTRGTDVVFLADLPVGRVEVTVMPLYLEGRYRKHDRSLPQTKWPCRRCEGRGCDACQGTGKTYPTSVEELIAEPVLQATQGESTRFHGMGREDIDARMLGHGRPFVLEVLRPRIRTIDVARIETEVRARHGERVEVVGLHPATAPDVVRVKEAAPEKSYRVGILGDAPVAKINEALNVVRGRAIAQRTPTRVVHRRSDRVRTRRLVEAQLVATEAGRFTLDIRTEAGTYVKEWVEGDGGRTDPSLAQLLGTPLKVEYLDVLEIHDSEEK